MEFLRIQIPTDRTSGTRTRATQMYTYKFAEICSTPLTTAPKDGLVGVDETKEYPLHDKCKEKGKVAHGKQKEHFEALELFEANLMTFIVR